ncbi:MAG TPA: AAA family ATPase, partial [Ktedonobacterales bacterium]|nr:AAA family ATPase [Ktedonobacterales bacterium]
MTYEATGDAVNGHRRASRGRAARKLTPTAAAPAIVDGPPALRDPAALLRNADWPRLPAVERAALLAPYAGLALPVAADGPDLRETADDAALRAWVADLVAQRLQGAAAGSLRAWLEDGTPNSHLYISGSPGRARTSVVATFARRALRRQPASPDYCYVPDPTALGHCWLLALAAGTGMPFAEALISAMRAILLNWEKPRERLRIASDDEPDETVLRARMVAASLGAIVDTVPTAVRPYLDRLSAALTAVCANSIPPVVAEIDVPAGRIQLPALDAATIAALPLAAGTAAEPAADPHPPVIVSSLSRMDLTRSLLRANGGVLVLLAADFVDRDQVTSELATLRGVLRAGMVYARGAGEPGIPITTRVVLIGSYVPFRVLERAEEFVRLFRYKIRFDEDTDWVPESEAAYAALLAGVAEYYHLPPFDPTAVGRVVEEGARRASHYHREHLTADLPALRDLAVEAGKLALARHASPSARSTRAARADAATSAAAPATRRAARTAAPLATTAADVEAAIAARRTLQSGQGRLAREMVLSNHEIVPTVGAAVGQINGLGVSIS